MQPAELRYILDAVSAGNLSTQEAFARIKSEPVVDLGYAQLDMHRSLRQGVGEVVYGGGKTADQIVHICTALRDAGDARVLITRVDEAKAEALKAALGADLHSFEQARLCVYGSLPEQSERVGKVVVVSAGTSDVPVAEEAALTAECMGSNVVRCYDVGVSGIHRLMACAHEFADARAIVAVAGMEGALPSVVGGMASCPVLAVPTSVGYGASFGGVTALLSMLNSCASGVSVVNIDNGFGAGYQAALINRQSV